MAVNTSTQFQADIRRILDHDVLPLAQRHLIVYQFATKKKLDAHSGTIYTATRYNRLPLPYAPLNEGVAPIGQTLAISQVTGVALQWGDKVTITDVANLTIEHDLVQQAKRLLGYQISETQERNTFVNLCSGTQVNFVNSRGARASLVAGDVLDPTTVNRTVANLKNLGAPMWNGEAGTEVRRSIESGAKKARGEPMAHEHYVAVASPLVTNDFANNATVVLAWSYSDINRLYINEAGQWRGMHFVESNMVPSWVGVAAVNGTAGTAGSLATGTYYVQVTGSDTQNQYESRIYQVSSSASVTGPNGSISVTVPSTAGFTYSIYVGTSTSPANLGLTTAGPTTGPYAGQAVQIPAGSVVTLTGVGLMQIPPAAPATGVTVFPTFVFGQECFTCLELEKVTWTSLFDADKSDPLNQLRVVGWKQMWGVCITNQNFFARIESSASNTGAFT